MAITDARYRRRLDRLRDELLDEGVPLPVDGPMGQALIEEIDHARYPPVHEGHVPTYGVLLITSAGCTGALHDVDRIPADDLPLAWARRLADGRGSFLARTDDDVTDLLCFDHSIEYEANLVELARAAEVSAVQRTGRGHVKVITPTMVVVWDGTRWLDKPHAEQFRTVIERLVNDCDAEVLSGLLELTVHWLSPGFHGAIFVWSLHRAGVELSGVDLAAAHRAPTLRVDHPRQFSALLSLHSQLDGATLVDPDGTCTAYGATLIPTAEATETVPPERGTRHTSARRFSYDHPGTVVFVVSDDGPVSIYVDGARVAIVRASPSGSRRRVTPEDAEEHLIGCPHCGRILVVDLPHVGEPIERALICPVCGGEVAGVAVGAVPRGVATDEQARREDVPARETPATDA